MSEPHPTTSPGSPAAAAGGVNPGNAEAIEAWNTVLFDKFSRFRPVVTRGLSHHGDAVLDTHPPAPGARVLDLGCGFGDSTIDIARRVGPAGRVVGVDAAARFIEIAAREAAEAGVGNVSFQVADVQAGDLGGPYEYAFSRFGMMFFASPVRALANVRRSLSPGGLLAICVWRRREDNDWLYAAQQAVEALVTPPEQHDAPTCGPGPFSMAGADMVSSQLVSAGYHRIRFERHDADICIGADIDEAIEGCMALGPAGEILRLAGDQGRRREPEVRQALRETLARFARKDGVWAPSSTWIITARPAA